MKVWNSFSTEKNNCIYCGRVTYDYKVYEIQGLSISVAYHYDCDSQIDNIMKNKLTEIKRDIKEWKRK